MIKALEKWAAFGTSLLRLPQANEPNWSAVYRLIGSAKDKYRFDCDRLAKIMADSNSQFSPLTDPFQLDFELHRWLKEDREEAYSDWLEWIIRQLKPEEVFRLFRISPSRKEFFSIEHVVKREFPIPYGHDGCAGRLDLLIEFS